MTIHHAILEQMQELNLRMHRLFNDRMRTQGASLAQLKLLSLIQRSGPLRSTDIADALGQAPRTVTEAVDGLERDRLVVRTPDPRDRRAKRISLTEDGKAVIRDVAPLKEAIGGQLFEVLDAADEGKLLSILETLNERLVEMGAPSTPDANGE